MDTGNYLVNGSAQPWHVIDIDDSGTFTTFSTQEWNGYYSLEQDHDTGYLVGQYNGILYELRPGASPRTTLATLAFPSRYAIGATSRFDLQSAASKRILAAGAVRYFVNNAPHDAPAVLFIDQ